MSELEAFTVETTIEPNCTCADCAEDLHDYAAYDNHRCLRLCGACAVHILQARLDRVTELVEEWRALVQEDIGLLCGECVTNCADQLEQALKEGVK